MRLIAAVALLVAVPVAAHASEPLTGQWLTENGRAVVRIAKCGQGMCGRIVKILKPRPGSTGLDERNPDPALKGRKIEGLTILPNLKDSGSDWQGRIYSPEDGRDYAAYVQRLPDGTLQVKGCLAAVLCRTQIWQPRR